MNLVSPPPNSRILNEASSMDEALNNLNRIWGTEDNILIKSNQPVQPLLYRHELKDFLQRHTSEATITNTTVVDSLKSASRIATEATARADQNKNGWTQLTRSTCSELDD